MCFFYFFSFPLRLLRQNWIFFTTMICILNLFALHVLKIVSNSAFLITCVKVCVHLCVLVCGGVFVFLLVLVNEF